MPGDYQLLGLRIIAFKTFGTFSIAQKNAGNRSGMKFVRGMVVGVGKTEAAKGMKEVILWSFEI